MKVIEAKSSSQTELLFNKESACEAMDKSTLVTTLDELIINSVRARPALWNPEAANKFPSQTQELWEQVCKEVGQPIHKRDQIKKMWGDSRNKFMKARKVALKWKPSGAAASKKKASAFIFYEEMLFLVDVIDVPE